MFFLLHTWPAVDRQDVRIYRILVQIKMRLQHHDLLEFLLIDKHLVCPSCVSYCTADEIFYQSSFLNIKLRKEKRKKKFQSNVTF